MAILLLDISPSTAALSLGGASSAAPESSASIGSAAVEAAGSAVENQKKNRFIFIFLNKIRFLTSFTWFDGFRFRGFGRRRRRRCRLRRRLGRRLFIGRRLQIKMKSRKRPNQLQNVPFPGRSNSKVNCGDLLHFLLHDQYSLYVQYLLNVQHTVCSTLAVCSIRFEYSTLAVRSVLDEGSTRIVGSLKKSRPISIGQYRHQ